MDEVTALLKQLMAQAAELSNDLTEEEQATILRIFAKAIKLIEEKKNQRVEGEGGGAPPEAPTEVPSGPYPSSNVEGFNFDPKSGKLLVQFHGPYPKAKGPIYEYEGVPPYIYDIFARGAVGPKTSGKNRYHEWIKGVTPSLGGSLNALLKAGQFKYRKLS